MHDPLVKMAGEKYPITIDYTGKLPGSDVLATGVVTIDDTNGNAVTPTELVASASATIDAGNNTASITLINTAASYEGSDYVLTVTVTTDNGNKLSDVFPLQIRETV